MDDQKQPGGLDEQAAQAPEPAPAQSLADAYRAIKARAAEKVPTIPLELPSGAVFQVRRPAIDVWLMGGRFPQRLMYLALSSASEKNKIGLEGMAAALASDMPDGDAIKILIFARELVCESVASPKIVILEEGRHFETGEAITGVKVAEAILGGPPIVRPVRPADEISADELVSEDFWFIFAWAAKGAKGIPILTGNGMGATVESVETFRAGDKRGSSANPGADKPEFGLPGVGAPLGRNSG